MVTALALCSVLALSVPPVFAQSQASDAQRYSSLFQNVFSFVLQNFVDEVDPKVLYEGAMKGMLDALNDPYSTFLDSAAMSDLQDTTVGQYGGIGLYISKTPPSSRKPGDEPWVEVVSPIEDTPGWRAGIQPGDWISEIDGVSTAPLAMDEVLKKLRGTPGSTVVLTIRRGENITFPVAIVRALIEVPSVKRDLLPNKAGYLRIVEFNPQTPSRVKEAVEDFKARGAKAMVIDLRNNPGGLLSSAIDTADLFLESGVIVSTKSRTSYENQVYRAKPSFTVPRDWPVIILINRGSASASEILAGALKDQKRAYLVGERSYGKGAVQQIFPLGETGFKLTMSRYYTPSDANIDKVGISPDLGDQGTRIVRGGVDGPFQAPGRTHILDLRQGKTQRFGGGAQGLCPQASGLRSPAVRPPAGATGPERASAYEHRPGLRPGMGHPIAGGRQNPRRGPFPRTHLWFPDGPREPGTGGSRGCRTGALGRPAASEPGPRMRQFVLPSHWSGGSACVLSGEDAKYLLSVLRMNPGDRFPGLDTLGRSYDLEIKSASQGRVELSVCPASLAPKAGSAPFPAVLLPRLVLVQALPKGRKMDLVVRQAAEAGVSRVIPVESARSVSRIADEGGAAAKRGRWERIVREALQQSGSTRRTEVEAPQPSGGPPRTPG